MGCLSPGYQERRPASGEHIGGGLRPEDVVDPSVECRRVHARLDAAAVFLRERDPCAHEEPEERFAPGLELALDLALDLALGPAGLSDLEHLPDLIPRLLIRLELR